MLNAIRVCLAFVVAACSLPKQPAPEAVVPNTDAAFLSAVAQVDMMMAHIGKMAEDRAARGPVKDFGRALVLDHTNDYEELTNVAASTGYVIPKAIEKKNYRVITMLNRYQGKFFDRAFLARQASEHKKLMQAFKRECEATSNSIIKMYATNALPTISIHLYDAQALLYPRFRIIAK